MAGKSLGDRIAALEAETMADEPEIRAFLERIEIQAAAFPDAAASMSEEDRKAQFTIAQFFAWRLRFGGLEDLRDLAAECRRAECPAIFIMIHELSPEDLRV